MKRIDMASGEPARSSTLPSHPTEWDAREPERFESTLDEVQQVEMTYAFWTSLFARPQTALRERLVELEGLRRDSDDPAEQRKLDGASHAIAFVLRAKAAMPDAGATLV